MLNYAEKTCIISSERERSAMFEIIDRLAKYQDLKDREFISILNCTDMAAMEYLTHRAREACDLNYGKKYISEA